MSSISTYAADYSQSYYYKNYYSKNRALRESANRKSYDNATLVKADSTALKKAISQLTGFDYSDSNGADIINAVMAFADTYNNTMDSSKATSDHSVSRLHDSIKKLTKEQTDALEKIGITVKDDGSISVDKDTLGNARLANVKKVFSDDSDFMDALSNYAKKVYRAQSRSVSFDVSV